MNNIKRLREKHDISIRDLATKVNISYVTLSRLENGIQKLYDEHLIALADYFKVSIDYLLGRDFDDPNKTIIKTREFEFSDVLNKLSSYSDKQLYKLAGVIDFILENRDKYNPQQIKNTIDKVTNQN
jgi:transcriptional regulator with XRE-family HTH domain